MEIQLSADWLLRLLLIATRLAGLLLLSPVLGLNQVPARVRLLLVLTLSGVLILALPSVPVDVHTMAELMLAATREFLLGALAALGIYAAFAAFNFAGHLLDAQIGFNAAVIFDTATQTHISLLASLFGLLAGVMFLTLNVHYELLRMLARTFDLFPIGAAFPLLDPGRLAGELGLVFLFGLALASPIVLGILLMDIASAFVSRSLPQLNIYFVTLPLKIFWGLFLMTFVLGDAGPLIVRLFAAALTIPVRVP